MSARIEMRFRYAGAQEIVRPTDSESTADSANFIVSDLGCQGIYSLHLDDIELV